MKFSRELKQELEERDMSLKVRGNRQVAEDYHHEVCDFVIQYGEPMPLDKLAHGVDDFYSICHG